MNRLYPYLSHLVTVHMGLCMCMIVSVMTTPASVTAYLAIAVALSTWLVGHIGWRTNNRVVTVFVVVFTLASMTQLFRKAA